VVKNTFEVNYRGQYCGSQHGQEIMMWRRQDDNGWLDVGSTIVSVNG